MVKSAPAPAEEILHRYFRAKDANRPHLLDRVFAPEARLQVHNKSSAISFPAVTLGRAAIAEVLVREFGRTYENVYSFYLSRPGSVISEFSCDWLVGMTEKESGIVRVGCGRYDWTFQQEAATWFASGLVITIEAMQVLAPSTGAAVLAWLERLAYPWSDAASVAESAPTIEDLAPVLGYLAREAR
jgi:hypothetical protein